MKAAPATTPERVTPSVVYVTPDKMGGMMNIIANLITYRGADSFPAHLVLTHNTLNQDEARFAQPLPCATQTTFEYTLPIENLHAVMRRLARKIPAGPGVIVAGDLLDLAMLSVHDVGRAVVLILHGDHDYYYDLAVKHDLVVHAFVVYSRRMYERLLERLPHRISSIFFIPYGVPIPAKVRSPGAGPLRAIFAGRLEHGQKGVLDLPKIDAALCAKGVRVTWTIVGSGPDERRLRKAWTGAMDDKRVEMRGPLTNRATIECLADHDVFVLPTRYEGFPVALIEAMGAGLVPVVSNIKSGVPEVVERGVTGFTPAVGDIAGFAESIERLSSNRELLERLSARCRDLVVTTYDVRVRAASYDELYSRFRELYRPLSKDAILRYGSRLDRRWMPNPLVRLVRSAIRSGR
jgi:glycosyltransferase involved in cell wall biosynthesis